MLKISQRYLAVLSSMKMVSDDKLMIEDLELSDFDIVDYLETPEALAIYLNVVLDEEPYEPSYQIAVLENVMRAARSRGFLDGLASDVDFQAHPITSAFAVMRALGLRFTIEQMTEATSDLST